MRKITFTLARHDTYPFMAMTRTHTPGDGTKAIGLIGLVVALICLSGCITTSPANCINVTCNGVTSCRAPDNIPPCVPIPVSTNTSVNGTEPPTCLHGYVCDMASDGCAVPGAVYNCPNKPVNISSNGTEAVNLAQELNNSNAARFSLNEAMFHANSSSACSKQLITPCDNNVPSQFICINEQYAGTVSLEYHGIYRTPGACPEFLLGGNVYCGLDDNYCVVEHGTGPVN